MSKATKRKYVTKEVLDDYVLPEGNNRIVQVVASKGNNLHEVRTPNGETYLVSMPTKFRKNVWIKRGDYVMVEPIEEGDKVKAEIVHILYKQQIKYIAEQQMWPEEFAPGVEQKPQELIPSDMLPPSDSESDSENEGDLPISNPNRPLIRFAPSDEDSSSDETSNVEEHYVD